MGVIIVNGGVPSNDPEFLKTTSNMILSYAYDAVSKYPEPNREDYETEEDYKKAFNDYLLQLVEYVSRIKYEIFTDALDSYNESLSLERDLTDGFKDMEEKLSRNIEYCKGNIRRGLISTFICTLLFPNMFPVFLGFGGVRYLINNRQIKRSMIVSQEQKNILKQFRDDKEQVYLFQDSLRTDYHSRKSELEELKNMILSGKVNKENKKSFIERLRQLINPETYSFEKLDEDFYENRIFLLRLLGKDVLIEDSVQLIKK